MSITIDYSNQFKDILDASESYSFLLKTQQLIRKLSKETQSSQSLWLLITFSLTHLNKLNEAECCISILSLCLSEYKRYHPTPDNMNDFLINFKSFINLLPIQCDKSTFRRDFFKYCNDAQMPSILLQQYDIYLIFAYDSLQNNKLADAYRFSIQSENYDVIDKVIAQICDSKEIKTIDEKNFLIARMTLELLLVKNTKVALRFIGKYVDQSNQYQNNAPVLNFAYMLASLISIAMHDFGKFWALINIYKPIIDQEYFYAKYLNKISIVYYNKPFLKEEENFNLMTMLKSFGK